MSIYGAVVAMVPDKEIWHLVEEGAIQVATTLAPAEQPCMVSVDHRVEGIFQTAADPRTAAAIIPGVVAADFLVFSLVLQVQVLSLV